jgi:lysozyme
MNVCKQIKGFEGVRKAAYPDPLTGGHPWTIGCGHTGPEVSPGCVWDDAEIEVALQADVEKARKWCAEHLAPWFDGLNEPRQAVLIGMAFQMGGAGLAKFVQTLGAVRDARWYLAAECMRQSTWAKQTPRRANMLAHQMETGEWQGF